MDHPSPRHTGTTGTTGTTGISMGTPAPGACDCFRINSSTDGSSATYSSALSWSIVLGLSLAWFEPEFSSSKTIKSSPISRIVRCV